MKIILGKDSVSRRILGEQNPSTKSYRWMNFLLMVPVEEGCLIWNLLTKVLIFLETTKEQLLYHWDALPEKEDLVREWFLVPEDMEEWKHYEQMEAMLKLAVKPQKESSYVILPTTVCNARCPYCFETGFRRMTMSPETARKTAAFLLQSRVSERVKINWFGGEPLVNPQAIDTICTCLREAGVAYTSGMTTNGYLWDQKKIAHAKEAWALKSVQITLDGTKEVYNSIKNYKNAMENPYGRVLENIKLLLEQEIWVRVRLNVSLENADNLILLVEELAERFSRYRTIQVYAAILYEYYESNCDKGENADWKLLLSKYRQLVMAIQQKGMAGGTPRLETRWKQNHCMADRDNHYVISPEGLLTKCEHYCDSEGIGTIDEGITESACLLSWKQYKKKEEICRQCFWYPDCLRLEKCPIEGTCTEEKRELKKQQYEETIRWEWKRWKESRENHVSC